MYYAKTNKRTHSGSDAKKYQERAVKIAISEEDNESK